MFRLNEGIAGPVLGSDDIQSETSEELSRLNADMASLKRQIANQISHIQELTWEAQDAAAAKKTLDQMRETIRTWHAQRDLLSKLLRVES
jgi:septal ring factor EnvC (AmiA/AmiB activator)